MEYIDRFDKVVNDRDGNPIGDEETTQQEMLAAEGDPEDADPGPNGDDDDDEGTEELDEEDLEEEEMRSALEEEDEPQVRDLSIRIKVQSPTSLSMNEIREAIKSTLENSEEVTKVLEVEVDEA